MQGNSTNAYFEDNFQAEKELLSEYVVLMGSKTNFL